MLKCWCVSVFICFSVYWISPWLIPCTRHGGRQCCQSLCRCRWACPPLPSVCCTGTVWWNQLCRWNKSSPHRTAPAPPHQSPSSFSPQACTQTDMPIKKHQFYIDNSVYLLLEATFSCCCCGTCLILVCVSSGQVNRPWEQHKVETVGSVPLSFVESRSLLHQVLQVSGVHLQPSDHVVHVALVVLVVDFTGGVEKWGKKNRCERYQCSLKVTINMSTGLRGRSYLMIFPRQFSTRLKSGLFSGSSSQQLLISM